MQKKSPIKTLKESITWKVITYILLFTAAGLVIDISFLCMNMASTFAFVIGVILFAIGIGVPVEIIANNIRKKKEQNNNQQ